MDCSDESCQDKSLDKISFCTGSEDPSPVGFGEPITVQFDSNTEWPLASTCALQLTLPSKFHDNCSKFQDNIVCALLWWVRT